MALFASDIQRTILEYYGSNSTIWQRIQTGTATEQEIIQALGAAPQVQPVYSQSGYVLGYDWAEPLANDLDVIIGSADSNSVPGSYSPGNTVNALIPANFNEQQGGGATISSGLKDGLGNTVAAIADKVNLAVTGANIGAKIGKSIGTDLYNANPQWWADNLPDVGPWFNDVFGQDNLLGNFVRTFLTVDENGTTAYVDEKVLASYYQMLRDKGALEPPESEIESYTPPSSQWNLTYGNYYFYPIPMNPYTSPINYGELTSWYNHIEITNNTDTVFFYIVETEQGSKGYTYGIAVSKSNFHITWLYRTGSSGGITRLDKNADTITLSGVTYYYEYYQQSNSSAGTPTYIVPYVSIHLTATGIPYPQYMAEDFVKITFGGDIISNPAYPGVGDIPSSTQYSPSPITGTTTQDVLNQLKQEYPDLFTGSLTSNVLQPDGTYLEQTYIPIPWCDDLTPNQTEPTTDNLTVTQSQDRTLIEDRTLENIVNQTGTDNPPPTQGTPDTGNGQASTPVIPSGSASSLWAIYNPTQTEINNFGAWLWSSNFVEQLKKLFNDPMQAIIGVHKVFATPVTGSNANIKCGYIDSGVSAKTVTDQYTSVSCGSVNLYEYFGNVFDYDPFTSVKIYLPFIGIVPLDVSYIMRSTITVDYKVDVLSGACIANVKVTRDGFGSVLFTYGGSAIVSYPVSSGSYMGIVSGALSLIAGVAGTIASGGALAPAMVGAAAGIGRMKTDVQHSGQFSGACGAMGAKKPYLIISRPQTRVAENIERYNGIPSNTHLQLSECTGYTQVKSVHLSIPGAYDSELQEIEQLLKDGIII